VPKKKARDAPRHKGPRDSRHDIADDEMDAFIADAALNRVEQIGPHAFGELFVNLVSRGDDDPELAAILPTLLSDEVRDEVVGLSVEELRNGWDALSDAARALVVHTVVDHVVVRPGPGTAAERVSIVWATARSEAAQPPPDEDLDAEPEPWRAGDIAALAANPFYAIQIDPMLATPHETIIDEEDWIRSNVKLIENLGPEAYLRNLLSVLKGGYV
jgi:hypothetical protein